MSAGGVSETATVNVTVTQVDDAASFGGATSGTGNEDAAITGQLTASDAADGMTAPQFTVSSNAVHGTASIDAAGNWSYTPAKDYNGADSFTVSVKDDDGNIATQVISLTVTAAADAVDDTATVAEDASTSTFVLGNDGFSNPGRTVTAVTQGAHGTVTIVDAATGEIQYTPAANYHGSDSYTYTVTSNGVAETATVNVTVTAVNDPTSFAGATSGSGTEDGGAITGTLSASDADGLSAPNFTVSGAATHGTATIDAATGAWSYTPLADYHGADSFTVTVTDNDGNTASKVVSLAVTAVADIAADSAVTAEDNAVVTNVLANDTFENAGRTVTAAANGAHGTVAIVDPVAGTVRYTPDANFHGADSYTYTVTSNGITETATVSVLVAAVNDSTAFGGNTSGTGPDDGGAITGTLSASDVDGLGTPNYTVTGATGHGSVRIDPATGAWSYTPAAGYHGSDSFTVKVTDDDGNVATQVVSLTVTAVDDVAPPALVTPPVLPPAVSPAAGERTPDPAAPILPAAVLPATGAPSWSAAPVLASSPFLMPSLADLNVLTLAPTDYALVRLDVRDPVRVTMLGSVPEILESLDRGFPAVREAGAGSTTLSVLHGVPDIAAEGAGVNYTVPNDAFVHTDPRAIIQLEARLADGRPLPSWLRFDGVTGLFNGRPDEGGAVPPLQVEILARDNAGREARTSFRIAEADRLSRLASDDRGFPVVRMSPAQLHVRSASGGDWLVRYIPIDDVQQLAALDFDFQVPTDAFAHTNPRAVVHLQALLADGRPLPSWLHFDGVTGRMSGTPPRDFAGTLDIRVIARDDHGLQAETRLRLNFAPAPVRAGGAQEHAMAGKRGAPGFAEQLRQVRVQPARGQGALVDQALLGRPVLGKADAPPLAKRASGV